MYREALYLPANPLNRADKSICSCSVEELTTFCSDVQDKMLKVENSYQHYLLYDTVQVHAADVHGVDVSPFCCQEGAAEQSGLTDTGTGLPGVYFSGHFTLLC